MTCLVKRNAKIILSAILSRPVEFNQTKIFVVAVNSLLRNLCLYRCADFIATYKPFVKYGQPILELFSPLCGLHPNHKGNIKLTNFLVQVLAHC